MDQISTTAFGEVTRQSFFGTVYNDVQPPLAATAALSNAGQIDEAGAQTLAATSNESASASEATSDVETLVSTSALSSSGITALGALEALGATSSLAIVGGKVSDSVETIAAASALNPSTILAREGAETVSASSSLSANGALARQSQETITAASSMIESASVAASASEPLNATAVLSITSLEVRENLLAILASSSVSGSAVTASEVTKALSSSSALDLFDALAAEIDALLATDTYFGSDLDGGVNAQETLASASGFLSIEDYAPPQTAGNNTMLSQVIAFLANHRTLGAEWSRSQLGILETLVAIAPHGPRTLLIKAILIEIRARITVLK